MEQKLRDPFSSSSVCDYPGTIVDNGTWDDNKYIGLVFYPIPAEDVADADRNSVWGCTFKSNGAVASVEYAGITFNQVIGTFEGMAYENKAIRLESSKYPGKNKPCLVIYYWGTEKAYDKNWEAVERTLNSIKLKKMR